MARPEFLVKTTLQYSRQAGRAGAEMEDNKMLAKNFGNSATPTGGGS